MADISKITLPNGNTYDIKDSWARSEIESLESIDNGVRLIGVTTTTLTDNATTTTIVVNSANHTAKKGDLVFYDTKEFLFDGTKWHLLDEISTHGALASKDKVKYDKATSASYTNSNSTKSVSLSGTSSSVTITATTNTNGNYTPAGTVSQPSFSNGSINGSGKTTPEGTVSQPTFSGTKASGLTVSPTSSGTITYTPEGSVAAPTISVKTAGATNNTLKPVTAKSVVSALATAAPGATAPANAITYYAVADETLSLYQIGATKTDSVTLGSAVTVKTGDAVYEASAPAFTGTGKRLVLQDYTPAGTVSQPTFTGTEATVNVTGTATGTVSKPTFAGTAVQLSGTTTASGSVTLPTISLGHTSTEATYE